MQKLLLTLTAAAALLLSVGMMMKNHHSDNQGSNPLYQEWIEWKLRFGKSYSTAEEDMHRFSVYVENLRWIEENQGDSYTLQMNGFGDLTREEFQATYLMQKDIAKPKYEKQNEMIYDENISLPAQVNWATQGMTVNVLNQGQCGSCWAFSATEQLDSAYAMSGIQPVPNYSEQQVVSCSAAQGNYGCNGGWPVNAYKYMMANPLCSSSQYPYVSGTSTQTGTCNNNLVSGCQANGGTPSNYTVIPTDNCGALEQAVATQPISVCVDASKWSYYQTGVFHNCGTQLDHCVLAVGYNEGNYWIIQNSWGTSWGQQGFIWLKWGNTCGVCQQAQYAAVN